MAETPTSESRNVKNQPGGLAARAHQRPHHPVTAERTGPGSCPCSQALLSGRSDRQAWTRSIRAMPIRIGPADPRSGLSRCPGKNALVLRGAARRIRDHRCAALENERPLYRLDTWTTEEEPKAGQPKTVSRGMLNRLGQGLDGPPSGLVSDPLRLCHGTCKKDYIGAYIDRKIFEK